MLVLVAISIKAFLSPAYQMRRELIGRKDGGTKKQSLSNHQLVNHGG
jgi:hypothetical protein